MAEPTNNDRASWANTGVSAFAVETNMVGEDEATIISDFLGDLMHLCDAQSLDFDELVERGRNHYLAETGQGEYPDEGGPKADATFAEG